ncbi:MAG TPA: M20 family metallopeptidase [Gemmatimonadales bacterium]|nr:M20 family metallopeptidase [Gemmatimonadales bacterium]
MNVPPVDRAALVRDRRDLHQHPELGFKETRTGTLVHERLRGLGYDVRTGVGRTGVVGLKGSGTRCVLLRADMDALPIEEANDVPYRSRHPGAMHACGHDGHVAIGLEVARRLAAVELPGAVKFAFQPAEELSGGATAMIGDGILAAPAVSAAFGIHVWNELPVGTIGIMAGAMMASVDEFDITITGTGGHAAIPHRAIDPVLVAAHVITALQSLVSRRRDPFEEGVVSVTQVSAGHAFNVIPATAMLRGTVRTFGGKFYDDAPRLVEETARGIARALGADAGVAFRRLTGPLVNDPAMAELMKSVGEEIVGTNRVKEDIRTMGGEDMSYFLKQVPGCFAFVGSAKADGSSFPHHSPRFDIEEEALPIAAELLTRTTVRYLAG